MSDGQHLERLYRVLVELESLLDPRRRDAPARSLESRVAETLERGTDAHNSRRRAGVGAPESKRFPETNRPAAAHPSATSEPPADPGEPTAARDSLSNTGDASSRERRIQLDALAEEIVVCTKCPLSMGRTNAVPGEGVVDPLVMFVGEGPGYNEDQQGRPFVGKAGQYLDRWLETIGLSRESNAYIANIVKCRPPNNRDPQPLESETCSPYLRRQIELVRPKLLVTVGRISTRILTGSTQGITRIHGTFFRYEGISLVPTFHPSAVLRNPDYRRPVWEDLKKIRNWLIDNTDHRPGEAGE